jgi:hypothetical protein
VKPYASLLERRLVVVTGKGGVGKTAIAAALGRISAASAPSNRVRRVLVIEIDPRDNLHQMFAVPPSGGELIPAGPGLWVQNLQPEQVMRQIVREQVRLEMLVSKVLASRIFQHFAAGAPGLRELAVLGHALRLLRKGEFDQVILDAPATGHGISLLAAPQLVTEVVRSGPFGRMAAELAEFVADPAECVVAAVTLAEEMPVEEVLDLRRRLEELLGRPPALLLVNGLYPPLAPEAGDAGDAGELWRQRRQINERQLARLRAEWSGPGTELPLLPLDRGPALIAALSQEIERGAWS